MPEVIFRRIWQDQLFNKSHLTTSDGRPVNILSPGTPNMDGGPDFLNAKISIGRTTFHGDIELHINAEEWLSHKHDSDPHYNKVILHVVVTAGPLARPARTVSNRVIPLLVLHPFLDETFHDAWTKALADDANSSSGRIVCSDENHDVPQSAISPWIEKLARERLELKVRRFEERLKQLVDESRQIVREPYPRYYGNPSEIPEPKKEYTKKSFADRSLWEQLVYEALMEAMGYAKNAKPFLALARSAHLRFLREHADGSPHKCMAMLFGAAGLLPSSNSLKREESREYVAGLKTIWNALRPAYKSTILNEGDWLFFRLRPVNFPTVRLAAMSFLIPTFFGEESFRRLIGIFKSESLSQKQRIQKLHDLFDVQPDEFWQHHYHFKGKADKKSGSGKKQSGGAVTIGAARINDILINAILPIAVLYARLFNDGTTRKSARSVFAALPASQENATTEHMQRELMREKLELKSAQQQQGTLQLYRFYCAHARCLECAIGRHLVETRRFEAHHLAAIHSL